MNRSACVATTMVCMRCRPHTCGVRACGFTMTSVAMETNNAAVNALSVAAAADNNTIWRIWWRLNDGTMEREIDCKESHIGRFDVISLSLLDADCRRLDNNRNGESNCMRVSAACLHSQMFAVNGGTWARRRASGCRSTRWRRGRVTSSQSVVYAVLTRQWSPSVRPHNTVWLGKRWSLSKLRRAHVSDARASSWRHRAWSLHRGPECSRLHGWVLGFRSPVNKWLRTEWTTRVPYRGVYIDGAISTRRRRNCETF